MIHKLYLSQSEIITPHTLIQNTLWTSSLTKDYPNFIEWYNTKVIPGLIIKDREIILYTINNVIAAISILKNYPFEKKMSTIRVLPPFEQSGLGKIMFIDAFKYLGCEKPILTIPENKVYKFKKLLDMFGFRLSDVNNQYERNNNNELVYNI